MGRKVLSIWLAVLLLLTGCSQQNTAGESTATVTPTEEPAVVSVDWSEEKVYSAPVENEEYFFYAAKKGIVRIDKKTGERKKIVSKGEIEFICLAEDGLYYSDGFYLYSCGFSGENAKEIFYSREIKGVDEQYIELWDMQIHEGKTYFLIAGLEMVQIDIESKTAEQIGWDVRSGCFWGDSFYYRRRSSEEIYKVNLETKKEEVVRDQHIRKDEREGKDVKV
ncbi:MAG: DUF5050 domain-containing protein, partial [Lachnospiraceae bacterium]|nr:DUF5050 domain-containing protein [Lachnospiraceae bacterium]